MPWWMTEIIRRVGNGGAVENVRRDLEARRFALAQADALARRLAPPEFRRQRTRAAG